MKIGEIKREALLLIFPEIEARFNEESEKSVNEGIEALKCDPSVRSYLEASVPSINRAICEIENAGASKTKRAIITVKNTKGAFDLQDRIPELMRVLSIHQNGKNVNYVELDGFVLLEGASAGEIEVVYKSRVEKIRYITEEAHELDLDFGVVALIPYFVASELCETENGERARELRARFFNGISSYSSKSTTQDEVEAIYSW